MNMHRILVLDDDIGVCTVLGRILRDRQYDVHTIQSVGSAAEALEETSFDAYLIDYLLQDGTGLQVAERVRQKGSTAPIILISGYGATDIAARTLTLDIFEVLQKPFTRETVCDTLERALSHALNPPLAKEAVRTETTQPRTLAAVVQTPAVNPSARFGPPHVVLIAAVLVLVAFCIFLMLR